MKLFGGLKKYAFRIVVVIATLFLNVIGILMIPKITVNILDIGVANGDVSYIVKQGLLMLLVDIVAEFFMVISIKNSTFVATSFAADLRKQIFEKVQKISIYDFEQIGASSMIIRSTDDINQIQMMTMMGLRIVLRAPLMFIGAVIMAIATNRKLAAVFSVSLPIVILIVMLLGKKLFPMMNNMRKALDNINRLFRQTLSGMRVIRAFDRETHEEMEFAKANADYSKIFKESETYSAVFVSTLMLIMNLTLVAIIYFGARMILNAELKVGELLGFIQYSNNVMMSFLMLTMIITQVPRAQSALSRVNEVLDIEDSKLATGKTQLDTIEDVEFKDVSFKYPDGNSYTLENINFKAKRGDTIGIIGATGSGKTTIANLLVRFFDTTDGEILINGKSIKEYEIHSLRDNIGYTEQKASLISGTVSSNVSMDNSDFSMREMTKSLEIAQADFIVDNNDYYHVVAQKGRNFSGGQKQRISIARAIYKNPSLYLIDDSFSALDYQTEKKLRAELSEESKDAIKIIITQRATVVADADLILLLDEGKMIGKGTHEELKNSSQEYREILTSQDFEGGKKYA